MNLLARLEVLVEMLSRLEVLAKPKTSAAAAA
jgi:hypothetical protein